MNTLKTLPGNQALYPGTLHACVVAVPDGTIRLIEAPNGSLVAPANTVVEMEGSVVQGLSHIYFDFPGPVSSGQADGFFVHCPSRPDLFSAVLTGSWNAEQFRFEVPEVASATATATFVLSPFYGMLGVTLGHLVQAAPAANLVAWRWDSAVPLAIRPQFGDSTYPTFWPRIAAGASGLWHVDTLSQLVVAGVGGSGTLHLMLVREEGRSA